MSEIETQATNDKTTSVEITNINISFIRMVSLMVKATFAAIPAMLIVVVIMALLSGFLAPILGSL